MGADHTFFRVRYILGAMLLVMAMRVRRHAPSLYAREISPLRASSEEGSLCQGHDSVQSGSPIEWEMVSPCYA